MSKQAVNDKAIIRGLVLHTGKVNRSLDDRAKLSVVDFQRLFDLIGLCADARDHWLTIRAHLIETNQYVSTPNDVMKSLFALDEFFRE